jgi:hypothetical protein
MDDPVTTKPRKMKDQKARERGWGEVFFGSYRGLLEMCEQRLNTAFYYGHMDSWWKQIIDVPPSRWQASAHAAQATGRRYAKGGGHWLLVPRACDGI